MAVSLKKKKKKRNRRPFSRAKFEALLFAVHNYPHFEGSRGAAWTDGMTAAVSALFCTDAAVKAFNEGYAAALELYLECMSADNPAEHLRIEEQKGLRGDRGSWSE